DRLQSVEEWRAMLSGAAAQAKLKPVAAPAAPVAALAVTAKAISLEVPPAVAAPEVEVAVAPSKPTPVSKPLPTATEEAVTETPAPVVRRSGALQNPRDVLVMAAAAALLLVGLLSLPGLMPKVPGTAVEPVASLPVAGTDMAAGQLPVVNAVHLPNGLIFEAVETATGTMTVVAAVPSNVDTTLQVGDVLLVYAASGETLGTSTALSDILKREFALGIASYSFVVRRGESTMDAGFRLEVAG
ncbi:MAG: hypothetical protein ACKO2N_16005, partial [Tabrizicola sp.]